MTCPRSAVSFHQPGQRAAVGQLLQRAGKQGQPRGRGVLMKQYVERGLFHDGGEYAHLAGEPVLANIEFEAG